MNRINLKSVDKSTWIRTFVLLAALINQALVIFGVTEKKIDEESFTCIASYALTAISSIWSWWKNNSFTERAQQADGTIRSEYGAKG